jgi:hypothetical protein
VRVQLAVASGRCAFCAAARAASSWSMVNTRPFWGYPSCPWLSTRLTVRPTSAAVTTRASLTRSTLRSVKLLIELPACSKKAQKSIEKKAMSRIAPRRSRSRRVTRVISKTM